MCKCFNGNRNQYMMIQKQAYITYTSSQETRHIATGLWTASIHTAELSNPGIKKEQICMHY